MLFLVNIVFIFKIVSILINKIIFKLIFGIFSIVFVIINILILRVKVKKILL